MLPGHFRPEAGESRDAPAEASGSALPFTVTGSSGFVLEDPLGRPVGLLRARDPVHRRGTLQARGRVHDVPGHDPLAFLGAGAEGDHGLARVDADPHLQRERRVFLVQLLDRLEDAAAPRAPPARRSSSCVTGAPNAAITASPMNFSTVPPYRSISSRRRAWYGRRRRARPRGRPRPRRR